MAGHASSFCAAYQTGAGSMSKPRHSGIVEDGLPAGLTLFGGTSVSDDAGRACSGALGAALDHLPPAPGSRRSLPRPVPGNDRRADIETDVARVAIRGRLANEARKPSFRCQPLDRSARPGALAGP